MVVDYRDRQEGSESKLNTYTDGFKVIKTILRMFRDYKPLSFFSTIAAVLAIIAIAFFIPIFTKYLTLGVVKKVPSLIVICIVFLTSIICMFSGIILTTLVQQHKQDFEFKLQMVNCEYKRLFPEEKSEENIG